MQPPPEDLPGAVESPPEPNAFDPGVETGYLRRAPREGPPDVEQGARPFEPGDEVGFDGRRAKRRRRRREREERERAEAEEAARREAADAAEREREHERAEAEDAEHREATRRAEREAEEEERRAAERTRLEAAEQELEEAEQRAVAEAERARREAAERERGEREARARAEAERAEREAEQAHRRERERREREEAEEHRRLAAEAKARKRQAKAQADALAPPKRSKPPQGRPVVTGPPAKRRRRRPARPMPAPGAEARVKPGPRGASAARATAGGPGQAPPRPSPDRRDPGLGRPTAKLGGAALAATAAALLLGSLIGLPTPFSGSEGGVASLNAQGIPVGSGTAAALYRGPFHPVRGEYDYGEGGARFGAPRGGRLHEGQDVFSKSGTPLVAVRDGVVVDRAKASGAYSGGRGNYVAIYSPIEHRSYVYLHLLRPALVDKGERVHAGELLGQMGCTGSCYGTHLHFEVRRGRASFAADTKAVNPLPFLQNLPQAPEELAKP